MLQHFYNLSDEQADFQLRDRHSFCRFLGLSQEARVPDAKTIWLFRERLKEHGLVEDLFQEILSQIHSSQGNQREAVERAREGSKAQALEGSGAR